MGGKTATSTSQIQIPPEVMAQYNAVNARAEQAAGAGFQPYSNDSRAFVAGLTGTQQAAINNINDSQGMYRPYFDAATQSLYGGQAAADPFQQAAGQNISGGLAAGRSLTGQGLQAGQNYTSAATGLVPQALSQGASYLNPAAAYTTASAGAVNPTALGSAEIGKYLSPYLDVQAQGVLGNLRQQQQQEQSALTGNQIMQGAFGGDRGGIASANLARQQNLATAQTLGDIYNTGYSQALGAAQQQQGVALGAGQANRAALGAAGAQLGQLGQQAYGQTMGASSALQGLGDQAYSQAIGAGQQLYGQGLGAASAQSALGNQLYGQGSQTSSQLAQLGSGAQAAALAGAQAQMGAGTAEQQTQQAGLQALYNQFLQQQGYPFQVAQFLAGIAMGTGSLSGSTTTSTQPTSFFGGLSDRRMKRDIRTVGKTYDGQDIISFRYPGEKHTQLGLVAQDVEKKHPAAVREMGGLKYVDYAKATAPAARRGHFAAGGVGAVDPNSWEQILQMQKSMFPYNSEGMGRTGGGTGPWGVGLAQLPRYELAVAKAPKIEDPGLHGAIQGAEDLQNLGDMASSAWKWGKDKFGDKPISTSGPLEGNQDLSQIDRLPPLSFSGEDSPDLTEKFYRGGLATRKNYLRGGMPYRDSDSYVPYDDSLDSDIHKLPTAEAPGAGGGGSGIKDVIDAAKLAASFFYRGGIVPRHGYADGGDPDDDNDEHTFLGDLGYAAKGAGRLAGEGWDKLKEGVGYGADELLRPAAKYLTGWDPGTISGPDIHTSGEIAPDKIPTAPTPGLRAARPAPEMTPKFGPIKGAQDFHPQGPELGPSPRMGPQRDVLSDADLKSVPTGAPSSAVPQHPDQQGWMSRNQSWLVPMLKGLGAMASSPSRYLGSALLQGVGAGAGAYEDVQNQIQKRKLAQAQEMSQYNDMLNPSIRGYMVPYTGPDGTVYWQPISERMKEAQQPSPGSSPTKPGSEISLSSPITANWDPNRQMYIFDAKPSSAALERLQQFGINPSADAMTNYANLHARNPTLAAENDVEQKIADTRTSDAGNIERTHKDLLMLAQSLMMNREGLAAPGKGHEDLQPWINTINHVARVLGVPPPENMNAAEGADDVIRKVKEWSGAMSGSQFGYHAQHVADTLASALPSAMTEPHAAQKLMSALLRASQSERDYIRYARNYMKSGVALGLQDSFASDMTPLYNTEEVKMKNMMNTPAPGVALNKDGSWDGENLFAWLIQHQAQLSPNDKQKLAQHYGPDVLRWLNVY